MNGSEGVPGDETGRETEADAAALARARCVRHTGARSHEAAYHQAVDGLDQRHATGPEAAMMLRAAEVLRPMANDRLPEDEVVREVEERRSRIRYPERLPEHARHVGQRTGGAGAGSGARAGGGRGHAREREREGPERGLEMESKEQ